MKKILSLIILKKIHIIANKSSSRLDFETFIIEKNAFLITRKKNKLRSNYKVILFVGRSNYRKELYDIIQIWEKYFKLILLGIKN